MIPKTYLIASFISVILILLTIFLGYTFIADAEAAQQIYAKVTNIDQVSSTFTSATLTFTINITNPTDRDIHKLTSTFKIYINEYYIGNGSFSETDVGAQTSTFKQVTATVSYKNLADSAINILQNWVTRQNPTLKITGTITASILFGLTTASHQFIATSK